MTQRWSVYFFRVAGIALLLLTFGAAAAQANPFSAVGSGVKSVAVAVANGAKKVVMIPVKGVEKVKDAF